MSAETIPHTPVMPAPVKNIYQRMNQVMQEVDYVQKKDSNNGLKYKFASHDEVTGLLHGPITRAGIVVLPAVESYGMVGSTFMLQLSVDFVNIDDPSDRVVMKFTVPSGVNGTVSEKSFGATYSYACKYALLKAFMLETGEDADQDSSLSGQQVASIMDKLGGDMTRLQKILDHYKVSSIADIPADKYYQIMKRLDVRIVEVPNAIN